MRIQDIGICDNLKKCVNFGYFYWCVGKKKTKISFIIVDIYAFCFFNCKSTKEEKT